MNNQKFNLDDYNMLVTESHVILSHGSTIFKVKYSECFSNEFIFLEYIGIPNLKIDKIYKKCIKTNVYKEFAVTANQLEEFLNKIIHTLYEN
jgi:hypothetical protein